MPDPDVQRAIEQTAQLCQDLGHEVVETTSPVDSEFATRFNQIFGFRMVGLADAAAAKAGRPTSETGMLDVFVQDWAEYARSNFTSEDQELAAAYMLDLAAKYADWLSGMDVFLSPVMSSPAPALGRLFDPGVGFDEMFERVVRLVAYTPIQNALGLPAMSVPTGMHGEGLPIGSHFVAPAGREDLLFALAYELEQALPWAGTWAPVSVGTL